MKNNIFSFSLTFLLSLGVISCQENSFEDNNPEKKFSLSADDITYPSSDYIKSTRSIDPSFENNWEDMNILVTDHGTFELPWAQEITDSNLPIDFAYDIKKEDGWKMLFHTFNSVDDEKNYMAFYNQRTGMLKVFYYLKINRFPNNGGAWKIEFTHPQRLLNFTPELAIPTNLNKIDYWACTNAVNNSFKSFCRGWNGFQVMLSYDPNINTESKLDISSSVLNSTNVSLFGENNSYSKGTILTNGSSNPLSGLTNDIASVFGTSAENWINDSIVGNTRSIAGGIAGAIAKFGVNKIFSKLTASLSQPTVTRSDLEFTTQGNSTIQGTLTFGSNSPATNLRIQLDKRLVGELGVWNLADQPIVYMNPYADYVYQPGDEGNTEFTYKLKVSRYDYNMLINPELLHFLENYWVNIDFVYYWGMRDYYKPSIPDFYSFGSLGTRGTSGGIQRSNGKNLYGSVYELDMNEYILYTRGEISSPIGNPLPRVYVPTVWMFGEPKIYSEELFMKMSLYTVTNFEGRRDTTISTRTFIPKLEWDPRFLQ